MKTKDLFCTSALVTGNVTCDGKTVRMPAPFVVLVPFGTSRESFRFLAAVGSMMWADMLLIGSSRVDKITGGYLSQGLSRLTKRDIIAAASDKQPAWQRLSGQDQRFADARTNSREEPFAHGAYWGSI